MNKSRRQELYDVTSLLDDAVDRLEEIKNDEMEALEAMPESLQFSSRGDKMQKAIDKIDEFVASIEKIKSDIEIMAKGNKKTIFYLCISYISYTFV